MIVIQKGWSVPLGSSGSLTYPKNSDMVDVSHHVPFLRYYSELFRDYYRMYALPRSESLSGPYTPRNRNQDSKLLQDV
jgi:hypothetical protein